MWTQIRLLLYEQFDLGLHSLSKRLVKTFQQMTMQMTFAAKSIISLPAEFL